MPADQIVQRESLLGGDAQEASAHVPVKADPQGFAVALLLGDEDLVFDSPLLAYLYPGRFAEIKNSNQLPLPAGFKR